MIVAVADTHAVHWFLEDDPRLSRTAGDFMDSVEATLGQQIAISSISLVEMVYHVEKGRIARALYSDLINRLSDTNAAFIEIPVDRSIAQAVALITRDQVPDMPDRIIAATALHLNVPVISRDSKIKLSSIQTIW